MAAPGVEDRVHLPKDQLDGFEYCIDSNPPWPEAIVLGFQHYICMLGTTVMIPSFLVPQMGGTNDDKARVIQSLLFVAGVNTFLQTFFGTRLPSVMGGSYAFLIPILTVINSSRLRLITDNNQRFLSTMRAVQGALIASSSLQIVLGFSGLWGIFTRFLSPLSSAPAIALVGLGFYGMGFPGVAKCVEIGLLELLLLVLFSLYLRQVVSTRVPVFERMPILLSVPLIWGFAYLLTVGGAYRNVPSKTKLHCRTDQAGLITSSPWIRISYPLQWGAPSFDAGHTFAMMAAAFTSLAESTAAFLAVSRLASATPPPAYVLTRGSGWQAGCGPIIEWFVWDINWLYSFGGKCWASRSYSCRQSPGGPNIGCLYGILFSFWKIWCLFCVDSIFYIFSNLLCALRDTDCHWCFLPTICKFKYSENTFHYRPCYLYGYIRP